MATHIEPELSNILTFDRQHRISWQVVGGEVFLEYEHRNGGKSKSIDPRPISFTELNAKIGEYNIVSLATDITSKLRRKAHEPSDFHFSTAVGVFRINGEDRLFADTNILSPDGDGYPRTCAEDQVMGRATKAAQGHSQNRLATLQKMFLMIGSDENKGCCSTPCMSCRGKMHGMSTDDTKVNIICLPVRSADAEIEAVKISKEIEIAFVEKGQAFRTTLVDLMNDLTHPLPKTFGEGESTLAVLRAGKKAIERTSGSTIQDEINASIKEGLQKSIVGMIKATTPQSRKQKKTPIGVLLKKVGEDILNAVSDFAFADDRQDKFVKAMIELGEDKQVAVNKRLVALLQNEFRTHAKDGNQHKIKKTKAVIVETEKGEFYFGVVSEGTGPTKDGAVQNALTNAPNKRNIKAVYAMEYDPSLLSRYETAASQSFDLTLYAPRELERVVKASTYKEQTQRSSVGKKEKTVLLPDADLFVFPLNDGTLDSEALSALTWHGKLAEQVPNTYKNPKR